MEPMEASDIDEGRRTANEQMEPRESGDIDEAKGELSGESESIEAQAKARSYVSKTHKITETVPGGNRTHI